MIGEVPARRRACSARVRVARVSRLIGNSDTTVKRHGWQVAYGITGSSEFAGRGYFIRQMHKTPLQTERRFAVLRWSLASQILCGRRLSPPFPLQAPRRFVPFEGPLRRRLLLPGACSSLGWPEFTPAAGTSLAPYFAAIAIPFARLFCFNNLQCT